MLKPMLENLQEYAAGIVKYMHTKELIANTNRRVQMIVDTKWQQMKEIKVKVGNMVIKQPLTPWNTQ